MFHRPSKILHLHIFQINKLLHSWTFVHKKHYSSNITDQSNFFLGFILLHHIRKNSLFPLHINLINVISLSFSFTLCSNCSKSSKGARGAKGARIAKDARVQGLQNIHFHFHYNVFIFIFSAGIFTVINLLAEKIVV